MKNVVIHLFLVGALVSVAYGATVYKWVDKDGRVNFTDDFTQIPPPYRDRIETQETPEARGTGTPPASESVPKAEEGRKEEGKKEAGKKVDTYGRGEDYWRNRALPWKKQLKEATENYESANRRLNERLQQQSGRMLSSTQWNMNRVENRQLLDERAQYEAQMKEANDMLAKIVKEAEEAKADPEWLK